MKNKETDWLEWAGIPKSTEEKLLYEAKKYGVLTFDNDTSQDIYARVLSVRTYRANKKMVILNVILTITTIVSTAVALSNNL